jgi:hypothetical protein
VKRQSVETRPALIVLADSLFKEAYPGALHVLTAELACDHPVIWVEAPLTQALKAPGFGGRLRRSLRLDLPLIRYVDRQRELDILTPPLVPPGNWAGDVLLAQTVRWILKARKLEPRVLWIAQRGPGASALVNRIKPSVIVDFHDDPTPASVWQPEADLVYWPEGAPLPTGETEPQPRLMRMTPGVKGALKLVPTVRTWLEGPLMMTAERPEETRSIS